ncbi:MAG: 1,4-dihydroxy-2-naphthoate octaprenyltransferase [Elusimicrobia bacterium]|nr:1,4-dihydroxy-2-naphthoate octaprenyltransferase [Elusimicrobiota bacterium]
MKKIIMATRPYSWPASMVPVAVGSAVAFKNGSFSGLNCFWTFLAALMVHSGANLANSYFDWKNGIDMPDYADDRTIADKLLTPEKTIRFSMLMIFVSALIGIYLTIKNNAPLMLVFGAAGALLAWFYTADGIHYKYRSLGDAGIFLSFGPLIVTGTALIQTGKILPSALLASIPLGLLITGILHANNMRDISYDSSKNIKTFAQFLGMEKSVAYYKILIVSAYCSTLLLGSLPAAVLPMLSMLLAKKLFVLLKNGDLAALVKETAKFVGVFGLLLAIGLII